MMNPLPSLQVPWEGGRSADLSPRADRTPEQEMACKHCEEGRAGAQQSFPCGVSACRDFKRYHQDLHASADDLYASIYGSLMCSSGVGAAGRGQFRVKGCGRHARRPHIWRPKADDAKGALGRAPSFGALRQNSGERTMDLLGGWHHGTPGTTKASFLRDAGVEPKRSWVPNGDPIRYNPVTHESGEGCTNGCTRIRNKRSRQDIAWCSCKGTGGGTRRHPSGCPAAITG